MSKFFNSSRGPVTATIGNNVVMFPSKQWTVVDDDLGTSASLRSLLDQRILVRSSDDSMLTPATSSKPSKSAREAAAKEAAAREAAKVAEAAKIAKQPAKADASKQAAKIEPPKVVPAKDSASKIETPEPAPAPAPSTSKA